MSVKTVEYALMTGTTTADGRLRCQADFGTGELENSHLRPSDIASSRRHGLPCRTPESHNHDPLVSTDLVWVGRVVQDATVLVCLHAHGDHVTVSAFDTHNTLMALASTTLKLADGSHLWLDPQWLTYPNPEPVRTDYLRALGPQELTEAIESVGRTAIAALAGMEEFLAHARHLLIDVAPKNTRAVPTAPATATEIAVTVHRMVLENGLLDLAPGGEEFTAVVVIDPLTVPAGRESFIWPLQTRAESLPSVVDPFLSMVVHLFGGAE